MKRVMIICHSYSPSKSIGAQRIHGLKKYLPRFGWDVIVLTQLTDEYSESQPGVFITPPVESTREYWAKRFGLNPEIPIGMQLNFGSYDRKKESFFEKILNLFDDVVSYPDPFIKWLGPAVEVGAEVIRENAVDMILSSSKPETCHLVARELKKRFDLPWVADLRDLWTQNEYSSINPLRRVVERKLEIRTLSDASALTTVSDPMKQILQKLHPNKIICPIPTGFDPAEMNLQEEVLTSNFTITYTGSLYRGKRDPKNLFSALRELMNEGSIDKEKVSVRFFGPLEGWLYREVEEFGLREIVTIGGPVPREIALKKQRESQVLLLLLWNNSFDEGTCPYKVFEYLAARRPILVINGPKSGVIRDLIEKTGTGEYAITSDEIKDAVRRFYNEYENNGFVGYKVCSSEIDKYSQIMTAKKFATLFEKIISKY